MNPLTIKYLMKDKTAVIPTKAFYNDVGYDLTVIDIFKVVSEHITIFETGIAVSPPEGYYLEIIPRSSLSKSGYMLANSIGIIDPSYTGTLKIALIKVDQTMPNIELPFKCCQLVLRKLENSNLQLVECFQETERGDGGFGSTDKKLL
jgi:dUTP pyrophosphatase